MLLKFGLGQVHDRVERLGLVDGEVGEALAVELDLGELEAMDEPAIAKPSHFGGGESNRVIQSRRKSHFFARRSRNANMPGAKEGLLGGPGRRRRPPTNPSTFRNRRFFALLRAAAPFLARIVVSRVGCGGRTGFRG